MTPSRIWLWVAVASGALTLWSCGGAGLGESGAGGASGLGGGGVGTGGLGGAVGEAGSAGLGGRGTGGCNAIAYPQPVLSVFDAQTSTPICDPTFAILVQTDAGLMSADASARACTPSPINCPVSYDGGATPCPFSITVGYNTTGVTVSVSAPGYEPMDVPDVAAGRSGCVAPFSPASNVDVKLVPLSPDDGATSGPDGGPI